MNHLGLLFKSFLHLLISYLISREQEICDYSYELAFLQLYQFLFHMFGIVVKLNRCLGLLCPVDELDIFHYEVASFIYSR